MTVARFDLVAVPTLVDGKREWIISIRREDPLGGGAMELARDASRYMAMQHARRILADLSTNAAIKAYSTRERF